jgi:SAM-dependent methyltransferase
LNENRRILQERFLARLLAQAPASVLDVGCGDGVLLVGCRAAGVPCVGLETAPALLRELARREFPVVRAHGELLPFGAQTLDWVALRHVAHHLRDPRLALQEAARVARTGLVVAEPWRDLALPAQTTGAAIDTWTKRQDQRLGHVHGPTHTAAELIELLPSGPWECEYEYFLRPRVLTMGEVKAELDPRLAGLPSGHSERFLHDQLLERAARTGVGAVGTAIVIARRAAD